MNRIVLVTRLNCPTFPISVVKRRARRFSSKRPEQMSDRRPAGPDTPCQRTGCGPPGPRIGVRGRRVHAGLPFPAADSDTLDDTGDYRRLVVALAIIGSVLPRIVVAALQ